MNFLRRNSFVLGALIAFLVMGPIPVAAQRSNAFSTKAVQELAKALTDDVDFGVPRYTTALLPTCDTASKGALAWDTTTNSLKGCNGTSWAAPFDGTLSSGQFLGPNGTEGAPTYSWTSDPDTGLYRWSTGWVGISSDATLRFIFGPDRMLMAKEGTLEWDSSSTPGSGVDLLFGRDAAATLQLGADVNGAAVAQTLKAHDGITGTDVAGANLTLAGGRGTGAGTPGSLIFQTATALGSGTTAQSLTTRLTLSSAGAVFGGNVQTGDRISLAAGGGTTRITSIGDGIFRLDNATGSAPAQTFLGRSVEAVTTTKAASNVESFEIYTNVGDGDGAEVTLPAAATNVCYTFVVEAAQDFNITADAADTIRVGASVTGAGGTIDSATIGDSVTLCGTAAGTWVATALIGTGF